MAQFKFLIWLAYWYQQTEIFEFEWDTGNYVKSLKKHDVSIDEIESLFKTKMGVAIGRQIAPPIEEERLCVVGPTDTGRMLSVVFTLRDGRVRPISGRPAGKKERRLYEEIDKTLKSLR